MLVFRRYATSFAARSAHPYALEERAEKAAEQRYCLKRMVGANRR